MKNSILNKSLILLLTFIFGGSAFSQLVIEPGQGAGGVGPGGAPKNPIDMYVVLLGVVAVLLLSAFARKYKKQLS